MAQVLGPGEVLRAGESRFDETGRFEVVMQKDHNLVVYAYVIEPQIAKIPLGATNTVGDFTDDFALRLTTDGALVFFQPSTGNVLQRVDGFGGGPGEDQPGTPLHPGSTLHLFGGRLALFRPGGFTPEFVTFAMAGASEATERVCVMPGRLAINALNGGLDEGDDNTILNNTGEVVLARDGRKSKLIPDGGTASFSCPAGTLAIEYAEYVFPAAGDESRAPASPPPPTTERRQSSENAVPVNTKKVRAVKTYQRGESKDVSGSLETGLRLG